MPEPCFDVAHLGHVELYSDRFEQSLDFFTRVYGLTETARRGESSYLRAFDDYEHHTLKLTRYETTGVGHIAYRCSSAPGGGDCGRRLRRALDGWGPGSRTGLPVRGSIRARV